MEDYIELNNYYIGDSIWYFVKENSSSNIHILPNKIENLIIDVWTQSSNIYYKIIGRLDLINKTIDKSYGSDQINKGIFDAIKKSCIFNLITDYVKIEEEWVFDENLFHIDSYTSITYYNYTIETQYISSNFVLYKKKILNQIKNIKTNKKN